MISMSFSIVNIISPQNFQAKDAQVDFQVTIWDYFDRLSDQKRTVETGMWEWEEAVARSFGKIESKSAQPVMEKSLVVKCSVYSVPR